MSPFHRIVFLMGFLWLGLMASVEAQEMQTIVYQPDSTNFPSPERGFYHQDAPMWLDDEFIPQTTADLKALRQQDISLVRWYFVIDEFREQDLPPAILDYINQQFEAARSAGIKTIPRFAYNFPLGGEYPYQDPDASLEQVLRHLEQLTPLIRANSDVIAFMEIGLVGAWGEWHSSTNQLVDPELGQNDSSRAIVNSLLTILPAERMIAMRYPRHKQDLYGTVPLTQDQAFDGSPQARMGAHNDCFLASETDWGTYPEDSAARQEIRQYLHLDLRFLPQGGETCNDKADAQPYIGCENAVADLAYLRFSALNADYEEAVLQGWRDEGCYAEIERRLGYRLRLVEGTFSRTMLPSGPLDLSLAFVNEGFASPYNPRGFEIRLRSQATNQVYTTTSDPLIDPRFWLPELGRIDVAFSAMPTENLPATAYDVLLFLPDPMPSLAERPEYALRLANMGLWEEMTGYHKLGEVVVQAQ